MGKRKDYMIEGEKITDLKHEYFLVRHELSTANHEGTIIFDAEVHPSGRGKVRDSVRNSSLSTATLDELVVLTSPRRRCRQTTAELVDELGFDPNLVEVHSALDERNFGSLLEGAPKENYKLVYDADLHDSGHTNLRVESVNSVRDRVRSLVVDLERRYPTRKVFALVTHADPGEVLIADLLGLPPTQHRNRALVPKLQNAEVRPLPRQRGGFAT